MTEQIQLIEFSEWKIKNKSYISEGLSSKYRVKEKLKFRDFKINDWMKIEEGIILEYLERDITMEEKEYQANQQHLVGYHYISVIQTDKNKDLFWIQGNINNRFYAIFEGKKDIPEVLTNWTSKKEALKKFAELLETKYKLRLEEN